MRFKIEQNGKCLVFDSDLHGLRVNGIDYLSGRDGILIYDQVDGLQVSSDDRTLRITGVLSGFFNF